MAPPGSGTVWDRLREVQDRQDDAFILTMGIDVHSFTYLLDNGFSEQWNGATIDRNDVNSGATGGRSRPERRSLDAAGTLVRKTLMSTGYCYWKSKIRNFRERICM